MKSRDLDLLKFETVDRVLFNIVDGAEPSEENPLSNIINGFELVVYPTPKGYSFYVVVHTNPVLLAYDGGSINTDNTLFTSNKDIAKSSAIEWLKQFLKINHLNEVLEEE